MSSIVGQVIHCKAAMAWEPGKPLLIKEVEMAPPKKKMEVRLKIFSAFLRYTDIYFWEEKEQNSVFPRILGHEASVIVESAHGKLEESNMCQPIKGLY
ncbi:alcohol dehydrogenase 1-like [Nicotiana tabacum]|uniref:alcohol dehydrogenase n=2 Tax=Nicotiana TaxID=4085 RepID=A0A1S4BN80_TOBAC|nr:PREDICTED: alcohol dehydrogenase 1-like [Nicotiana sylvestris]XP_016490326.1 PREDICTED: alcohol dehydrogenase 1-like [Nicotiana tabacum]